MAAPCTLWLALVLLGALGVLQTPAQARASVQPNFQKDKFLGHWFSQRIASNSSWIRENKKALFMCKAVVAPAPPQDGASALSLTITFLRKGQCETQSLLLRPAGPPGCYSYTSLYSGKKLQVCVEETDYKEYALLYMMGIREHDFHMAALYSRTVTPQAAVKEKFTTFAKAKGFTGQDIVPLPRIDKCLEGHQ